MITILFIFGALIFGLALIGVSFLAMPTNPKKYFIALSITGTIPFLLGVFLSFGESPEAGNYLGRMITPCPRDQVLCSQPMGWLMMLVIMTLFAVAYFLTLYGLHSKYGAIFITVAILLQLIYLPIMLLGPATLILMETPFGGGSP